MYSKVGAKDADLLTIGKRKMSRKRKFFACFLFAATVLMGTSMLTQSKMIPPAAVDTNVKIVTTMDKPASGSPKDYSAYENFCIAAGIVYDSKYYKADTEGTITASVFGAPYIQTLTGERIRKDGKVFHTVSSTSTMKSVGEQRFFSGDTILMRKAKYKNKVISGWGDIGLISQDEFSKLYGFIPREICQYIVNEETVLDSGFVSSEGGYDTYYLILDPATAPERYKRQVATLGGASALPDFKSIKLTFTIDEQWIIQKHVVEEEYPISIPGLGDMNCKAFMTETFKDINADLDFPEEAQPFLNLAPDSVGGVDTAPDMTEADYLAAAFGDYLGGKPLCFSASLDALGLTANLSGYLDIANMNIRAQVGDLLYFAYENDSIYLSSGEGKVKIPLSSLTPVIDELKPLLSDLGIDLDNISGLLEGEDMLGTLFGNSEIVEDGDNVHILMPFSLMGLDLDIDMHLVKSGDSYSPAAIKADIDLKNLGLDKYIKTDDGNYKVKVDLKITDDVLPAPDESFKEADLSFVKDFIAPIKNMISAKAYALSGSVTVGNTLIKINDVKIVRGEALTVSANIEVMGISADIKFADNVIYISAGNVKLKAALEDLPTLIEEITALIPNGEELLKAMGDLPAGLEKISVQSVLESALKFLPTLEYENGELNANVSDILLKIKPESNKISVSLPSVTAGETTISADLCVTAIAEETAAITVADAEKYVSVLDLLPYIDPVMTLVNSVSLKATVQGTVNGADIEKYLDSVNVSGEIVLNYGKESGLSLTAALDAFTHNLGLAFDGKTVYVAINDGIKLSLSTDNLSEILEEIAPLLPEGTTIDTAKINGYIQKIVGLDLSSLIKFDEKTIGSVLGYIRALEYGDDALTVTVSVNDITVTAKIAKPEKDSGKLDIDVAVNYAPTAKDGKKAPAPINVNLSVTLSDFSDEVAQITVADKDAYVQSAQLADFISPVLNTIAQEKFDITFDGAIEGVNDDGSAKNTYLSGEIKVIPTSEISNASFPEMHVELYIGSVKDKPEHSLKLLIEKDKLDENGNVVLNEETRKPVKGDSIQIYANYNGMKVHLGYDQALKIIGAVCDLLNLDIPLINGENGLIPRDEKNKLETDLFADANIAGLTEIIDMINGIFEVADGGESAFEELMNKVLYGALNEALRSISISMQDNELIIGVENSLLENVMAIVNGTDKSDENNETETNLGKAEIRISHNGRLLESLSVGNLAVNGDIITLNAELVDSQEMTLPTSVDNDFKDGMNFDSLYDFLKGVINTANTRYFPISGTIPLKVLANDATLKFDLNVAIVDNPAYDPSAEKPAPKTKVLVGLKLDHGLKATSDFVGAFDATKLALEPVVSYLYFDGDTIYVQRDMYESIKVDEYKTVTIFGKETTVWSGYHYEWQYKNTVKKYCIPATELGGNKIMDVLFDILPVKESIKTQIISAMTPKEGEENKDSGNSIDFGKVLTKYEKTDNGFSLSIDLDALAGTNNVLNDLDIDIYTTTVNTKEYVSGFKADISILSLLSATVNANLDSVQNGKVTAEEAESALKQIEFGYDGNGNKLSSVHYTKLEYRLHSETTWDTYANTH